MLCCGRTTATTGLDDLLDLSSSLPPSSPSYPRYQEYHTDTTVRFVVTLPEDKMREAAEIGFAKKFKVTTDDLTDNPELITEDGWLRVGGRWPTDVV